MSWKRRRKSRGRNTYYSLSKKLRQDKKINESFLVMLNNLSLEEVIGLKMEMSGKVVNNRLYGLPLWNNLTNIVKDAILKYAYSATRTQWEAMRLLGLTENTFQNLKKKYQPVSYFEEEEN
jgi:hypothetical protein|tara:strand:+ start:262 stop:624 length:363 start_codon:yes stop_codon:yes gene_type:complete